MFYTYVLQSRKDSGFYIGSTGDLKKRKQNHDQGLVTSTKNRRPLDLLYYEAYTSKEQAQERERQLKNFGSAYTGLLKRLRLKK